MIPIQLFVFDFDGTLVDTRHDIAFSVNLALEEMGLARLPEGTIFGYVGKGVANLMTQALKNTEGADVNRAVQLFMKHYGEHLMDRTDFFPHCREILQHYAHKKMAVVSNKPARFIEQILEALDSRHYFSHIIGGDSFDNKKPDPMGLRHVMEKAGVGANDVLMVGDSQVDVDTARAAGVKVCGVTYGHATREEMEALNPDWLLDDLLELKELFG